MLARTFEFIGVKDWCRPAAGASDLFANRRTWLPLFAPETVRLTMPDWSLPGSQNSLLSVVSTNLGFTAQQAIEKDVTTSGSIIANLGPALIRDSSLLVLVRDNLALTEGYGDERWVSYQLQRWPTEHNFPLCAIGVDQPQRWQMRVKTYTLDETNILTVDRPCIYLSARTNDRGLYHWVFEALPRLKCLDVVPELRTLPLLVREPLNDLHRAFLKWIGADQEIIVTGGRSVRAASLYFPSIPAPPPIHPGLASWLDGKVQATVPASGARRRLLVSRRDAPMERSVANEDDLAEKLKPLGFERLVMSELKPADQVGAFRAAEMIVLPHGAAASHLLFAPRDCAVIELQSSTQLNSVFFSVWKILGGRYGYVVGEAVNARHDYVVDPNKVLEMIALASGGSLM